MFVSMLFARLPTGMQPCAGPAVSQGPAFALNSLPHGLRLSAGPAERPAALGNVETPATVLTG